MRLFTRAWNLLAYHDWRGFFIYLQAMELNRFVMHAHM